MKIGKDKILHIIAGAVIALVSLLVFDSWIFALLMSLIAGAFKEFWDSKGNGCVELADFLYTALGGLGGVIVWQILKRLLQEL